ncbi:MAG: hypothetical protein NZM34_13815, partial [Bernardetiaceae bacterium]|nr:hypothetical protein [Bernardetiaceae bacterium]
MSCFDYCGETLQIESFYTKKDCLGNDFSIGFSNKMRLYARFELVQINQETKERGENDFIYERRLIEVWRLVLTRPLKAGYMFDRFTKSVLLGRNITVTLEDRIESGFVYKGSITKNPDSV